MVRLFRFCLILWIILGNPVLPLGPPEAYESWNKDATRAEAVNAEASDAALEALRSQIVATNVPRCAIPRHCGVAILEDQLNALAPVRNGCGSIIRGTK